MPEHITLRGFVGKDPEPHQFDDGTVAVRFRIATTTRRFDPEANAWKDTHTNWYSVRCFRNLAMHVLASVKCGQPVVVTGRLQLHEWASDTGPRTIAQVDAAAVGHDLSFGTTNFARAGGGAPRPCGAGREPGGDGGVVVAGLRAGERLEADTGVVIQDDGQDEVFRPLDGGRRGATHGAASSGIEPQVPEPDGQDSAEGPGAEDLTPVSPATGRAG